MGERNLEIQSADGLGGTRRHEGFLRDSETGLLLAHARFSFIQKRNFWHEKMAWLNDVSSISGFMSGKVKAAMGETEAQLYQNATGIESDKLRGHGKYLVKQIIQNYLPKDMTHLKIPIRCRNFEKDLREYYWRVGEDLKGQGSIHDIGNYSDGISFQLRKI